MTVPLLTLALLWDHFHLGSQRWLRPRSIAVGPVHTTSTNLVSGLLFVGIGIVMIITDGTTELIGVLGAGSQYTLESRIQAWSARVPDLAAIAAIVVVALVVAMALRRRRSRRSARDRPHRTGELD
jgi:cytochrome c-type biogenesis protein